ncbi:MAG: neutral/alkaline non-lysosomal ceramidase N-terminal domain-containing protein [Planctomycetota bacterium]|nr:neutral/alkaline non-lysosomal ceramidase N-terminal domain-containing protein [Planctomycetota bacterium]
MRFQFYCAAFLMASSTLAHADDAEWKAGFAKVNITPTKPMWMSGYGSRNKPADGLTSDLFAKAAVIQDANGKRALFISTDLIGVPIKMVHVIEAAIKKKHGLSRDQLMVTCSHTHSGPALDDLLSYMLVMNDEDWATVRAYQFDLNRKILGIIDEAIADLKPARIATGIGKTDFAVNRRPPIGKGPVDHEVPVLRVQSADGTKLRGVIFGYACHNTVLSFYKWCGDYAGFATADIEDRFPDCVALFHTGCGADQNPLPRRTVELAQKYGRMLSKAVADVVADDMQPLRGSLSTTFKNVDLAFDRLPTKEEISERLEKGSHYEKARAKILLAQIESDGKLAATHPYPIQVWRLGNNVTWVALGGEIVVDYSLRLKKELGPGTWVTGYANHVMAYIPSERVLKEGGYEGGSSMLYYQLPSKWKPGLEDQIVETVHALKKIASKP